MVFQVSLVREGKKGNERYKSVYAEADDFSSVETLVNDHIEENEDLEGFVISNISRETPLDVLR